MFRRLLSWCLKRWLPSAEQLDDTEPLPLTQRSRTLTPREDRIISEATSPRAIVPLRHALKRALEDDE